MSKLEKRVIVDVVMIVLALVSVTLLFSEIIFASLSLEQLEIIGIIDLGVAVVFLMDFLISLGMAENKKDFVKKNWWEVLAAVPITSPTTQALRGLNLIRLFPLIRPFRFVRLAVRMKMLVDASKKFTKHAYLIYLGTIVGVVIVLGALGFHFFEASVNPHVHNFGDSVWWAFVTTATIGYGDIYPITLGGRIVAILLILTGISTLGVFIGFVNSVIFRFEGKQN